MRTINILLLVLWSNIFLTHAIFATPIKNGDPHYNDVGFFDIHVCNWPNRPVFFMMIFSSYDYKNIHSVNIYSPDKKLITNMALDKFRVIKKTGKPEKHAFINQIDIKTEFVNGWYSAEITLKDGSQHFAKDYVVIESIPIVSQISPKADAEAISLPEQLKWEPVQGAAFYQVFIRDLWNDGKLIYKSKLIEQTYLNISKDLLEADGWYSWMIHARDSREHVLLGDFNHGSLSPAYKFSIAPD